MGQSGGVSDCGRESQHPTLPEDKQRGGFFLISSLHRCPEDCLVTYVQRADVNAPICGAGATLDQETQQRAWAVETVHTTLCSHPFPSSTPGFPKLGWQAHSIQ